VDSAERGSLAGHAREIPAPLDVLAAAARLGGAGRLVDHLAVVSKRVGRTPAIEVERIIFGRQFRSSEKMGCGVGKAKRGEETKWIVVVDGCGVPLGNCLHSASPAEVKLVETALAAIRVRRSNRVGRPRQKPLRIIAYKAHESDPLRKRLRQRGIELICPQKSIAFDRRHGTVEQKCPTMKLAIKKVFGGMLRSRGGGNDATKRAVVAVSRNSSVLPHRFWVSGEVYEPVRNHSGVTGEFAQE
jgi:hypothetical protein